MRTRFQNSTKTIVILSEAGRAAHERRSRRTCGSVERNPTSWSTTPKIDRVRFTVVPDAITESLEFEKVSADLAINDDYVEAQKILAADLPAINLWYRDTVIVHHQRIANIVPTPSGSYSFLETAQLAE